MGDKAEAGHMRRRFFKAGLKGEERIGGCLAGVTGSGEVLPFSPTALPAICECG